MKRHVGFLLFVFSFALMSVHAWADVLPGGSLSQYGNLVNFGTYKMKANGNLVKVPGNALTTNGVEWYQKDVGSGFFFDSVGGQGSQEFVTNAFGDITQTATPTVCGFRLFYATNAVNGTLTAEVRFYNGQDFGATPNPTAAAFSLNLPSDPGGALVAGFVDINLPGTSWFNINGHGFEYGLKHISGGTTFGPLLAAGSNAAPFAGDGGNGGSGGPLGTIFNVWESWNANQQSGTQTGLWWFGGSPFMHMMTVYQPGVIPEPGSGLALALIGVVGLVARRRRK
ncbi:MAG TPA: PEP-CTERM sorting domain-containing protein [Pirellulaceae bacterium]|mgnify:CR=1 FL=1|nr:PEP-CTERM sorting domain-containing protein [Pirellulaceae bacterium]